VLLSNKLPVILENPVAKNCLLCIGLFFIVFLMEYHCMLIVRAFVVDVLGLSWVAVRA
jgi:hypothetical protein